MHIRRKFQHHPAGVQSQGFSAGAEANSHQPEPMAYQVPSDGFGESGKDCPEADSNDQFTMGTGVAKALGQMHNTKNIRTT
jgi:hypothetical protein